ncbi:MAG: hypothetical protein ACRDN0_32000 [Trebonia sp.]
MSCRVAHDAARVLYDSHRALGLDVLAVKLDTLRADLSVELQKRGRPLAAVDKRRPLRCSAAPKAR